jgi:vancomycin resistance protein YoaR
MRAEVDVRPARAPVRARRRGPTRTARWARLAAVALGVVLLVLVVLGLGFAGSSDRLAAGVTVGGAEVSGLRLNEAAKELSSRAAELASVPVTFTVGDHRWRAAPEGLDVKVDWRETVARAEGAGSWPLPFRGLKRIWLRFAGTDVEPVADIYEAGLTYELGRVAAAVDTSPRSAAIELDGRTPRIVPAVEGAQLDQKAARGVVVQALAGFEREPVALPVAKTSSAVSAEDLEPALAQAQTALSGPVRFGWGDIRWSIGRDELARLLRLPTDGRTRLEIGGAYATLYFERLARAVDRKPRDARFEVREDRSVRVVRAREGRVLDVEATSKALLAVALSEGVRSAELVVAEKEARFTTREARALGIERELARYTTAWSGDADRIQNLKRAARLLDGTRIGPGDTFSFNDEVGVRTIERGFRPAPVIVGREYKTGVGGGVSQVATTVFNAAWETGLPIVERRAHALYISRYEAGRDATVSYPDLDLKFKNDTGRWLVLRARPNEAGISVSLLGAPTGRRVVTEPGELRVVGRPSVKRIPDPGLFVGERVIEDYGAPAQAITVRRTVYQDGEVLYDENWYTYYRSEPRIVRVGTIPVPKPEPTPTPAQTETTPTGTGQTTTGQTGTTQTGTGQTTTGR